MGKTSDPGETIDLSSGMVPLTSKDKQDGCKDINRPPPPPLQPAERSCETARMYLKVPEERPRGEVSDSVGGET